MVKDEDPQKTNWWQLTPEEEEQLENAEGFSVEEIDPEFLAVFTSGTSGKDNE
jgi:uncharacterized protein YqcC (DUF446 family)